MNIENIIAALEDEKVEIRKDADNRISSIDVAISSLRFRHSNSISPVVKGVGNVNAIANEKYEGYHKLNNRQKALMILRNEGRFLHMREITKIAEELESSEDSKVVSKKISTAFYTIKNLTDSPLTNVNIEDSKQNTFWGSKNWLDENGEIKKEHMYNEKEISTKKGSLLKI